MSKRGSPPSSSELSYTDRRKLNGLVTRQLRAFDVTPSIRVGYGICGHLAASKGLSAGVA